MNTELLKVKNMIHEEVSPSITKENLSTGIFKTIFAYYVHLEDPCNCYVQNNIQVYSSTHRDRRTSFRSKTTVNEYDDINQAGPSGMSGMGGSNGRRHVEEADWMDKLFSVKKKKIVRPKKLQLNDRQSSTFSKRMHMSSVMRTKQRGSSRKSSRAWREESREQFLTKLTKDRSEHRRKDYLKKTIGKHDTEVMGIQIVPLIDDINNHDRDTMMMNEIHLKSKISIQEPLKSKQR